MPKYKGIIFDLDGTLINSLEDIIDACNIIMMYYKFPTLTYEKGKQFVGRGLPNLIRNAIPEKYREDNGFIKELTEMVRAEYANRYTKKTKPYPGITEVLDYLKAKEIPFGVCTNKPTPAARSIVGALFKGYDFVDVMGYISDEFRKPNPKTALDLAERMGVTPEECLYVGDTVVDYETAINAGMLPVLCTWGFESLEIITGLEGSLWINKPIRIIDALLYGKEMYAVFNETPDTQIK